jgi:hypothetical protein
MSSVLKKHPADGLQPPLISVVRLLIRESLCPIPILLEFP